MFYMNSCNIHDMATWFRVLWEFNMGRRLPYKITLEVLIGNGRGHEAVRRPRIPGG
jgi:hypothetical protein